MHYIRDSLLPCAFRTKDDDAVCATEGTQWWIYDLGYDVDPTCYWRPWEEGGQVMRTVLQLGYYLLLVFNFMTPRCVVFFLLIPLGWVYPAPHSLHPAPPETHVLLFGYGRVCSG